MYIDLDVRELSYIDFLLNRDTDNVSRYREKTSRYADKYDLDMHEKILKSDARLALAESVHKKIVTAISNEDVIDYYK